MNKVIEMSVYYIYKIIFTIHTKNKKNFIFPPKEFISLLDRKRPIAIKGNPLKKPFLTLSKKYVYKIRNLLIILLDEPTSKA